MNHSRASKWFAWVWSALILIFLFLRAWVVQVTPDEAYTYNAFIQSCSSFTPWVRWEANNHLLNTILSSASIQLFGDSTLALRLPNVLSWPLFAWSAYQLLRPLQNGVLRSSGLVVLSASPMLLEFFALSRGYGMSLAMMLLSIHLLNKVIQAKQRAHWWWLLVASLLLLSNLNLLPFVLLSGVLVSYKVRPSRLTFTVVFLLIISVFVAYGIQLNSAGVLYYGGSSLWSSTVVKSVGLMTGSSWAAWVYVVLLVPVLIGAGRMKPQSLFKDNQLNPWLLVILLLLWAGVVVQHWVLNTPFPEGRTALHLWLLFIVMALRLVEGMPRASSLITVTAFLLTASTASTLEWNKSFLWKEAYLNEAAIELLTAHQAKEGNLSIGIEYPYAYTWSFIQRQQDHPLIPQRLSKGDDPSRFDVLLLNEESPAPAGYKAMAEGQSVSYRFHQRAAATNQRHFIEDRRISEQGSQEFLTILEEEIAQGDGALRLDLDLDLQVNACAEVFLVFNAGDGRYEQIELSDYGTDGKLKTSLVRFLQEDTRRALAWSVYLWNPSRSDISSNLHLKLHQL